MRRLILTAAFLTAASIALLAGCDAAEECVPDHGINLVNWEYDYIVPLCGCYLGKFGEELLPQDCVDQQFVEPLTGDCWILEGIDYQDAEIIIEAATDCWYEWAADASGDPDGEVFDACMEPTRNEYPELGGC